MPALGFGTWRLNGADCVRAVRRAIEIGYRHLDTAAMYGNEAEVGEALRNSGVPRDEIFVTTKIWWDRLRRDDLRRAAGESLGRLGLEHVDLLLVHWPNPAVPLAETLGALAELAAEGRTRRIGVANFPAALLAEAIDGLGFEVACDQVEMHPFLDQRRLLAAARERGVAVTAHCPLARGRVAADPVLCAIARKHGRSPAQVSLRWLLDHPGVSAIPKSASGERARENLAVFDFALDDADRAAIAALATPTHLVDPPFAPDWDAG